MFYGIRYDNEKLLKDKIEEYTFMYNNWRLQENLGMTPNQFRYHTIPYVLCD